MLRKGMSSKMLLSVIRADFIFSWPQCRPHELLPWCIRGSWPANASAYDAIALRTAESVTSSTIPDGKLTQTYAYSTISQSLTMLERLNVSNPAVP